VVINHNDILSVYVRRCFLGYSENLVGHKSQNTSETNHVHGLLILICVLQGFYLKALPLEIFNWHIQTESSIFFILEHQARNYFLFCKQILGNFNMLRHFKAIIVAKYFGFVWLSKKIYSILRYAMLK